MTSSIRAGMQRDQGIQVYKPFDPLCEPGLLSILFLSCDKHRLAGKSIASTIEAAKLYDGEIEWIFLEQGETDDATANLGLFANLDFERKTIIRPNRNYGINSGLNSLFSISRGEFVMIHESDWLNASPKMDFVSRALQILNHDPSIGFVRLRALTDMNENWGYGKPEYDSFTCSQKQLEAAGILVESKTLPNGIHYAVSNQPNGYCNNPIIIRKSIYRQFGPFPEPPMTADPRHGETEMQERINESGYKTAHIGVEIYYHIGGGLRKQYESF